MVARLRRGRVVNKSARWRLVACAVFFAEGAFSQHVASPDIATPPLDAATDPSAKHHYNAGILAFERGEDTEAYEKLRTAYRLDPNYLAAGALGQVAAAVGRKGEAANLLAESLHKMPATTSESVRARVATDLARLRAELVEVLVQGAPTLRCEVPNGYVVRGAAPLRVYLEPEVQVLPIGVPGEASVACPIVGSAGAAVTCDWSTLERLRLLGSAEPVKPTAVHVVSPRGRTTRSAIDDGAPPGSSAGSWRQPVAMLAGGLAVLFGATGGYLVYEAHEADGQVPAQRQRLLQSTGDASACSAAKAAPSDACIEFGELLARRTDQYNWAVVSFAAAGVLAATGLTLLVWDQADTGRFHAALQPNSVILGYGW